MTCDAFGVRAVHFARQSEDASKSAARGWDGRIPMNGIERQAAFYRGYLPEERSLIPLTVLLSATVALWLLVYCVSAVSYVSETKASQAPLLLASSAIQGPRAR